MHRDLDKFVVLRVSACTDGSWDWNECAELFVFLQHLLAEDTSNCDAEFLPQKHSAKFRKGLVGGK